MWHYSRPSSYFNKDCLTNKFQNAVSSTLEGVISGLQKVLLMKLEDKPQVYETISTFTWPNLNIDQSQVTTPTNL